MTAPFCPATQSNRTIGWRASVHHRRFENADHRGVRRLLTQVTDPMRPIAPVADGLAAACRCRRLAILDLELALQNRQAFDRAPQMSGGLENSTRIGLKIVPL